MIDPSAFAADAELLAALEKRSLSVRCREDQVLFIQGAPCAGLYVLKLGAARMTICSPSGDYAVCTVSSPGALLGLGGVIGNQPFSLTATAARGSELGFVRREDLSEMMLLQPWLRLNVLTVLAVEVGAARIALSEAVG